MDISVLREILEQKAAMNMTLGMPFSLALHKAQAEVLGKAGKALSRVELFCLRAGLAGAARSLAAEASRRRQGARSPKFSR